MCAVYEGCLLLKAIVGKCVQVLQNAQSEAIVNVIKCTYTAQPPPQVGWHSHTSPPA